MSESSLHTLQRVPSTIARDLGAMLLSRAYCSCGARAVTVTVHAVTYTPRKSEPNHKYAKSPATVERVSAACGNWSERCGRDTLNDAASAYAEDDYGGEE